VTLPAGERRRNCCVVKVRRSDATLFTIVAVVAEEEWPRRAAVIRESVKSFEVFGL